MSVWILPLLRKQGIPICPLRHTIWQVSSKRYPYACTGDISVRVSLKDSMLSLYRDILWRGFRHAVIRSIRTLSYRGDSYQRNILCSINRLNNLHLFVVGMVSTESTFCYTCHSNSLNSSLFNNNCIRYYKAIIKSQGIKDAFVWMLTTIE